MIKYVLFDVDGTLTEPSEGIINAVLYAMPRMGLTPSEDKRELYKLIGPPMKSSMQEMFSLSSEEALRMLGIYREYYSDRGLFEAYMYDGIRELLDGLRAEGYVLNTVTSKPIEYVERLLDHLHVRDRFTFLAADDLACTRHTKSEVFRYLFENVPDVTPENAVMLGDRKYDVSSAHEFGIRTVGCAWGHAPAGELEAAGADFIARTPAEAFEIIRRL